MGTTQRGYAASQTVIPYTSTLQCSILILLSGQQLRRLVQTVDKLTGSWIPNGLI